MPSGSLHKIPGRIYLGRVARGETSCKRSLSQGGPEPWARSILETSQIEHIRV